MERTKRTAIKNNNIKDNTKYWKVILFVRSISCLFFSLLFAQHGYGQDVYVSPNGNGTGDGSSWANAATLPSAITNAPSGSILWLRQGTYSISSTISFNKTLEIMGGFSGSGNQRDVSLYPSIIDGQGSVHMIQTGYSSSNTLFDGISFVDGYANIGAHVNDIRGGALYISGDRTRISNCIFKNNTSENRIGSGAIYLWNVDDILIENSLFENNRVIQNVGSSANMGGGAIHIRFGSNNRIENCRFINNSSFYGGGAIDAWGEGAQIIDCHFEGNHSNDKGGAIYVRFESVTISSSAFRNNTAEEDGGAIHFNSDPSTITNSVFTQNTSSGRGGAISNESELFISNSYFDQNSSSIYGGAIYSGYRLSLSNSLFHRNTTGTIGGAIYSREELYVTNSTFVSNANTAIVHPHALSSPYDTFLTHIFNSIFSNNTAGTINGVHLWPDIDRNDELTDQSTKDFRRNIFQENTNGTNNLVGVDPLFQDFANGNFSLQDNSPAVDHGRNPLYTAVKGNGPETDSDLAGNLRLFGTHVDAGAYELQSTPTITPPGCAINITPANHAIDVPVNTDITWGAVTGATGYRISIGTNPGGTDIADNVDINGTSYNPLSDLPENETIYVSVVPYNTVGSATGCPEISFTTETLPTAPGCATNITPADNTTGVPVSADITWDAVAGATGYRISIGTTPGATDIADNVDVNGTSYDPPSDLPENETIYVSMVPYNTVGSATGCPEISFTTETLPTAPGCATNITPADNTTGVPVNTDITWDAVAGATGYHISIGTTPGATDIADNVDVNGTIFNPSSDLPENETIYVSVVPYNTVGSATGCPEIHFTTQTLHTLPGCTSITAPLDGETNVSLLPTISWNPVPNATGYRLTVGTTITGGEIIDAENIGNITSYTLTNELVENTVYYIRVVPYNTVSEAPGCTPTQFHTRLRDVPAVTFSNGIFEYDGNTHQLAIDGQLPNGLQVSYSSNNHLRDVGEEYVTATISGNGYQTVILTARLQVVPKSIRIATLPQSKEYGEDDPTLLYSVTPELVEDDEMTGSLQRTGGEDVGIYTIMQGTLSLSGNYQIDFVDGTLHILPAPLTISLADTVKMHDGIPFFGSTEMTFSGFKFDDDQSDLSGSPAYTGDSQGAVSIGQYDLILSGYMSDNYEITYHVATLHILPRTFFIPNIITPNGDGINDFFYVKKQNMLSWVKLRIYNRWGQRVYSSDDYLDDFDGEFLLDGTYLYEIEYRAHPRVKLKTRKGYLTIIRHIGSSYY